MNKHIFQMHPLPFYIPPWPTCGKTNSLVTND